MSEPKSMKLPEIKKELLKILSDLESEGQKIFEQKQEENHKCQKHLNDRIAELETLLQSEKRQVENVESVHWITEQDLKLKIADLEAELAKRPVVYCRRDAKTGQLQKTGQWPDIYTLHHAKQWNPDSYSYEPYEGQTS